MKSQCDLRRVRMLLLGALGSGLTASAVMLATRPALSLAGSIIESESIGSTCDDSALDLEARYLDWLSKQSRGGESVIALKPYSTSHRSRAAAASLRVAIRKGTAQVELSGSSAMPLDVWLVDRVSQPRRSALITAGDRSVRVLSDCQPRSRGELSCGGDAQIPEGFELDLVVASKTGSAPGADPMFLGSPHLFQRIRARSVEQLQTSERPAQAVAGATLAVEPRSFLRRTIEDGERLFFEETFAGNGRTCGTCHPRANNLTIDPVFIEGLPDTDPLFVSENVPALKGLDDPRVLRSRGLIGLKLDSLENDIVFRGVLHVFSLGQTITPPNLPFDNIELGGRMPPIQRVGISADLNISEIVTLRDVATPAVLAFATRNQERVPGRDFRFPTDEELDALEAFMLTLGRQTEVPLERIKLSDRQAELGRQLFLANDTAGGQRRAAKCAVCHANAGANVDPSFFRQKFGIELNATSNANFTTGVNELPSSPLHVLTRDGAPVLRDGGFGHVPLRPESCRFIDGRPGAGGFGVITDGNSPLGLAAGLCLEEFNVPSLVEAADTPPFFHNNAIDTIEGAVDFYTSSAFKSSAAAAILRSVDTGGADIDLDATEVEAVAKFLRVLNAGENLRQAVALAQGKSGVLSERALPRQVLAQIREELGDARAVLAQAQLNPIAVRRLDVLLERVDRSAPRGDGAISRAASRVLIASVQREAQRIREVLIRR